MYQGLPYGVTTVVEVKAIGGEILAEVTVSIREMLLQIQKMNPFLVGNIIEIGINCADAIARQVGQARGQNRVDHDQCPRVLGAEMAHHHP